MGQHDGTQGGLLAAGGTRGVLRGDAGCWCNKAEEDTCWAQGRTPAAGGTREGVMPAAGGTREDIGCWWDKGGCRLLVGQGRRRPAASGHLHSPQVNQTHLKQVLQLHGGVDSIGQANRNPLKRALA